MMKTRRGLSTVVGTVFAIIALTTTITYVTYSMNTLDKYNQSSLMKNQQLTDFDKEKFQISSVTVPNNKFNITVSNSGSLPITFTKIWIQNTTTTDWINSYTPINNFVVPGGMLKNIGQNIPVTINSANSYNVKLVTSRGNTQQFTMNSPNTAPLNIQLLSIPSNVDVGFNSTLVMVITNNGSNTLTNIIPNTPIQTAGFATCSLGNVVPTKYDTLPPGSTAIFKWDVIVKTGSDSQSCTFTASPPLQNGYTRQSVSAKVTITVITFTQTLLAKNTGILTLDYTSFRWTQDAAPYAGAWQTGWSFPSSPHTVFAVNVTNNNATSDFYVSANSQVFYRGTSSSNTNSFWLVNGTSGTSQAPSFPLKQYTCGGQNDFCTKIPAGRTAVLYFGAGALQGGNGKPTQHLNQADTYFTVMLLYGKYSDSQTNSGSQYSQSLPYLAWIGT
ncbi:conserved exported hypothetical protein [Nitrosotalea sinensis]|uniref:Uncharacterized protein n=1 Tax=Nitrosotalea sinensis TaxID=1499975 RepID=A0A2H1EHX2_9ARCH|nr:hypothetical protein [Candidatus Nitrosotalea sinensis]SHO46744.1 conserved exported hypothetical protein [Candidatus Nitrosotalea sinensis]